MSTKPLSLLFILFTLFLSACSNTTQASRSPGAFSSQPTGDGFPIDLANFDFNSIADPIPQIESASHYGNPSSYKALGKTYYVVNSSKNYKKRGYASWYGTKFHGKRTSSGETYDMFAMTAANKTLPIPTYVKVKNLENGKEVVVKVNDRGPFHSDRIIDLSYTAAAKLGVLAKGTALVEVTALSPYQNLAKKATPSTVNTKVAAKATKAQDLYVQAGTFSSAQNAQKLRQRLQTLTAAPVVVRNDKVKNLYRVQIGPLANQQAHDQVVVALRDAGIQHRLNTLS